MHRFTPPLHILTKVHYLLLEILLVLLLPVLRRKAAECDPGAIDTGIVPLFLNFIDPFVLDHEARNQVIGVVTHPSDASDIAACCVAGPAIVFVFQGVEVQADLFAFKSFLLVHLHGEGHEGALLEAQVPPVCLRVLGDEHIGIERVPFAPGVQVEEGFVGVLRRRVDGDFRIHAELAAVGDGRCRAGARVCVGAELVIGVCCAGSHVQ